MKEGVQLPPPDYLMCKLIEMVNIENPPCANCDKRDPSSMYFCSTCGKCTNTDYVNKTMHNNTLHVGQALCKSCRENTHRAKMFSSHDIVQMSKRLADKTEIVSKISIEIVFCTYYVNKIKYYKYKNMSVVPKAR